MFITYPPYEFQMPAALVASDARHWRTIELSLHAPWFMLSLEHRDTDSGMTFVHTHCFAWDSDLAAFLPTVDQKIVRGLVCMAPGWKSVTGHWTSHEVSEVWLTQAEDGQRFLELRGSDGQLLDVGLPTDPPPAGLKRTLLLKQKARRRRRTKASANQSTGAVSK
jgi:hypothetical protein